MITRSRLQNNGKQSAPREWFVVCVIVLVCGLLQVPYVLAYLTAPRDTIYTGLLVNVEDANYITIIQRGSEGAWTHSLRFTSEPDTPAFLYVFYLAWGQLARLLNVDATTMWHIARVVMTLVAFSVTYLFIRVFFADPAARLVAFLLAILGAGFDWVLFPWETFDPTSATPIDFKMADAHLFHSALTFPHYLASITLLIILFWCAMRLLTETLAPKKIALLLVVGALANIGIALVYPFFVILACGVLGLYTLLLILRARKISPRPFLILGALIVSVVPLLLYYQMMISSSELLRVWSAQSQTLSPNPLHYLLTFAPYLILALLDVWRVGLGDAAQANKRLLLWTWVIVVALLAYAPLGPQRRFLQGVQIPLAILATFGMFEVVLPRLQRTRWFQKLSKRPNYSAQGLTRLLLVALILFVSLSSVYQWLSAVALTTLVQPYPLFRPRAEIAAMDWLRGRAQTGDVVLSAYFTGSYLPLRSGARVYLGHLYETVRFQEKQNHVDEFFAANTSDAERIEFLRANAIRYLFYGRAERDLGAFDPQHASYLERVYENSDNSIYLVKNP